MVKIPGNLKQLLNDPEISVSTSPFAPGKVVIKRSAYEKGKQPEHLKNYAIKSGECKGLKGTVIYKGKLIPKTAACVAEKYAAKAAATE